MDPTANLNEQLVIAERIMRHMDEDRYPDEQDARRLAELVEALHNWIRNGGFLPAQWSKR